MYIGGEINLTQFNEEIVESDLVRELSKSPNPQRTLEQLRDSLLHIQTQLRKYAPSITLLPEKSSPDKLFNDVVEAYSTLQAVDIIHRADRLPLTARAKSIINHALAYSDLARATLDHAMQEDVIDSQIQQLVADIKSGKDPPSQHPHPSKKNGHRTECPFFG